MSKGKNPKQVKLTAQQARALEERVNHCDLADEDKTLLTGLMSFNLWLEQELQQAKLGIRRLNGIFGIKTEKKTLLEL